ncbi:MAG: DUF5667 domain-containing protein [Candidatus Komeilibacteria bacterium]|nr:DUF5667 domain-containing protein [Candidatus Komeilibacteria bacterium]
MKKLLIFAFFALALTFNQVALAQDEAGQEATAETTVSEEVTAADLDVEEPTTLPTNGFGYFFKNLGRAIQTTLTFNQEKKAELQLKIADERLLEAKEVAEANPNNAKAQAIAAKSLEKYQLMMEKVQTRVEAIKEKNAERAEKLLDKIADHQLKQQQIMEKIEERGAENLTEEQKQRLQEVKEKALEKFGQFMERVEENQEKIKERLEKAAESAEGETEGAMEKLHNLRVIQRLGDKFENEDLRQGVEEANQTVREKFFKELKESDNGAAQEFNVQLENMSGQNADQLRVINFLKEGLVEQTKTDPALNALNSPLKKFEQNRLDNLKKQLEATGDADEQQELLRPLEEAGDVKSVEVLDRLRQEIKNERAKEALQNAQERKVERINERLEKMDDQNQVQELKKEINSAPAAQRAIRQSDPELMKKMDQRSEEIKKIQAERKSNEDRPNVKPADRPNTQNTDRPQIAPRKDNPGQDRGQGQGSTGQSGRPDQPQRQNQPPEAPKR